MTKPNINKSIVLNDLIERDYNHYRLSRIGIKTCIACRDEWCGCKKDGMQVDCERRHCRLSQKT